MLWQEVTLGSIAQYRQLARPAPTYASNPLKAITSPLYTKHSTRYHCSEEATPLNWRITVPHLWAVTYLNTKWFEHKKGIDCWTPECVSILQPYCTFVQENIHASVQLESQGRAEEGRGVQPLPNGKQRFEVKVYTQAHGQHPKKLHYDSKIWDLSDRKYLAEES